MLINKDTSKIQISQQPVINILDKYAINIFSIIYSHCNKFKSFYARQDTIAYLAGGYNRRTVIRKLPVLEKFSFIHIFKRGKHKTAEYTINAFFFTAPGRIILMVIFHISFMYFTPPSPGSVTQLNNNNVTTSVFDAKKSSENDVMLNPFFIKKTGYAISQVGTDCKPPCFVTPLFFEVSPEYYSISEYNFHVGTHYRNPVPEIFKKNKQTKTKKVKAKIMHNHLPFSEIQVDLIKMQPNEVYELALQTYQDHVSVGKIIKNPTSYFMALFNKQAALVKQKINTPKRNSYNKQQNPVRPAVEWAETDEEIRESLLKRKERILHLARSKDIDPTGYTLGEVELLIRGYKVIPLNSGIPTKIEPGTVTKSHDTNWNEKMFATPEFVTFRHELVDPKLTTQQVAVLEVVPAVDKLSSAESFLQVSTESYHQEGPPLGSDENNIDFDYEYEGGYN